VGIGTTGPSAALDVVGNIKASSGMVLGDATFAAPSGTAPLFGARAFCYVLANAAGTNPTILNSGNIASVTRFLVGSTPTYRFTFSTPMPNANYCVYGEANNASEGTGIVWAKQGSKTTTYFDVHISTYSTSPAFPLIDMKEGYNYSVLVVG